MWGPPRRGQAGHRARAPPHPPPAHRVFVAAATVAHPLPPPLCRSPARDTGGRGAACSNRPWSSPTSQPPPPPPPPPRLRPAARDALAAPRRWRLLSCGGWETRAHRRNARPSLLHPAARGRAGGRVAAAGAPPRARRGIPRYALGRATGARDMSGFRRPTGSASPCISAPSWP